MRQAIEQDGTSLQDGRIKVKVYVVTFDFVYYRGKNTNVTTYTFFYPPDFQAPSCSSGPGYSGGS